MKHSQWTSIKLAVSVSCFLHWAFFFLSTSSVSSVLGGDGSSPPSYSPPVVKQMVQPVLMPCLLLLSLCPSVCCYGLLSQLVCPPPPTPTPPLHSVCGMV